MITALTHRELCRQAARWLLDSRWCRVAGYEVGGAGDVFDAIGVGRIPDPDRNPLIDAEAAWAREEWTRRIDEWVSGGRQGRRPVRPTVRSGERQAAGRWQLRIGVVEVKRTRSDLLADLRGQKMLGYERTATSCWLAATPDALRITEGQQRWESAGTEALAGLAALGLPTTWGVLVVAPTSVYNADPTLYSLREATHTRDADPGAMRLWHDRIARSLAYRATGTGPVASEAGP